MDTSLSSIILNPPGLLAVSGLAAYGLFRLHCWHMERKAAAARKNAQAENNPTPAPTPAPPSPEDLKMQVELRAKELLADLTHDIIQMKLCLCSTWSECWGVMKDFEPVTCTSVLAKAWKELLKNASNTSTLEDATLEWVWQDRGNDGREAIIKAVDPGLHAAIYTALAPRQRTAEGVYFRVAAHPSQPLRKGEPPALTALRMFANSIPSEDLASAFNDAKVTERVAEKMHRTTDQLRETLHALKQLELSQAMRVARSLRGPAPADVKTRAREAFVHDRTVASQPFSREKERELQEAIARLDYLDMPDAYPDIHRELYPDADNTPQAKPN